MDNIDDLMRQKFDSDNPGERFEFQEEFWEQAEALLQMDEERRKRRAWLFWSLLLLLLLLLLGGWWYFAQNGTGITQKDNNPTIESPFSQESTPSNSSNSSNSSNPSNPSNQNQVTTKTSTPNATNSAQATSKTTPPNPSNSSNPSPQKPETQPLNELFPYVPLSIIWVQPPLLPVTNPLMPVKNPVAPDIPVAEKTKPAKDPRKFSAGFSLLASVNTPDTLNRRLGLAPGVYAQYRINNDLTLRLGAQYRITPGYTIDDNQPDTLPEAQLRYSFGFKKLSYERQTRALHHLEIPLSLQWNRKRIGLEAGTTLGMLIMVQQTTKTSFESSLQAPEQTTKNFVSGDRALYRPVYLTGFLGAEYRLSSRWAVTARAHYRFTSLEKPTEEGPLSRPGFIDFGVRYRLY